MSLHLLNFQRLSFCFKSFEEAVIKDKNYQRYIFVFQTMKITTLIILQFQALAMKLQTWRFATEIKSNMGSSKLQSAGWITVIMGIPPLDFNSSYKFKPGI